MQDMVGFALKFKLSCPGSRVLLFRDGQNRLRRQRTPQHPTMHPFPASMKRTWIMLLCQRWGCWRLHKLRF